MRFVKLALISAVILAIVIYLFSLIIPSQIRISRAIDISVSRDSLLPALADLRQWKQWNELVNNPGATHQQYNDDQFSCDQLKVTRGSLVGDTLFTTWHQQNGRT